METVAKVDEAEEEEMIDTVLVEVPGVAEDTVTTVLLASLSFSSPSFSSLLPSPSALASVFWPLLE